MNFRLLTAGLFFLMSLMCVAGNYFYLKNSIHNNLVKIESKNAGIYHAKDYDELKKIGYEWIYEVPMTDAVIQNMGRKRVGFFGGHI